MIVAGNLFSWYERHSYMKEEVLKCEKCWKPEALCLCSSIKPLKTRTSVLVLQHPQEARNNLTTARLVTLSLPNSVHRVGLSFRSLKAAVRKEVANPSEWAVLFVGTKKKAEKFVTDKPFQVFNRMGKPIDNKGIKGIVLLDGNWEQSKTLWWRNSWLLKLNRIVLNPETESEFFRKQPRKNCLSTMEATALALKGLGESQSTIESLQALFQKHVDVATHAKK